MTKSQFKTLKEARAIIDTLGETDRIDDSMPRLYRAAIGNTDDELGMLITMVEKYPQVFTHPFLNDELADHVSKTVLSKEVIYRAHVEVESHLEFTLTLEADTPVDEWEYENYLDEDDAWQDVKELINLGFKIELPEGTTIA